VQNRTISKKIGGKSAIEHKDGVQNQKGGKRIRCKIAKKKRVCKIVQLAKIGKNAIKPIFLYSHKSQPNQFIQQLCVASSTDAPAVHVWHSRPLSLLSPPISFL